MKNRFLYMACVAVVLIFLGIILINNITAKSTLVNSVDNDTDESMASQERYLASVIQAMPNKQVKYKISSSTPQFVLLSFDGSKSVPMLDDTLAFEQKMQTEGKPLHFTYFINAAYFLTDSTAQIYQAPGQPRGTTKIGFASSNNDISLRIKEFNKAFAAGNEIGSHTAGHFDGSSWTFDEWKQEFSSFASIMINVIKNNSLTQTETPTFLANIHGFRAPNLGVNDNLYRVLADSKFSYDASGVNAVNAWPSKDSYGIWHIPLGVVFLGTNKSPVISMDYNIWTRQSNDKELAIKGTELWNSYFNDVVGAYMNYFKTSYDGNRNPVVITNHFSKWNDGVYWEAMKAFAENVCGLPQVRCVTFSDVVNYLNSDGVPPIEN